MSTLTLNTTDKGGQRRPYAAPRTGRPTNKLNYVRTLVEDSLNYLSTRQTANKAALLSAKNALGGDVYNTHQRAQKKQRGKQGTGADTGKNTTR